MPDPPRAAKDKPQPPRPPNAWILYRADKVKELAPSDPSAPRLPQSDISKQISLMWKNEDAAVRGQYEQKADLRKAEHQAMYPGYRFQPVKRADKERLREEKKQEKERERDAKRAPATQPYTPPNIAAYPFPLYTHPIAVAHAQRMKAQLQAVSGSAIQSKVARLPSASSKFSAPGPSMAHSTTAPTSSRERSVAPAVALPSKTLSTPSASMSPPEPRTTASPQSFYIPPHTNPGEKIHIHFANKWGCVGPTPPMSVASSPVFTPRMELPTDDDNFRPLQAMPCDAQSSSSSETPPGVAGNSEDTEESDPPSPPSPAHAAGVGVLMGASSSASIMSQPQPQPPPLSEAHAVIWDPKDLDAFNASLNSVHAWQQDGSFQDGSFQAFSASQGFSFDNLPNNFNAESWANSIDEDSQMQFSSNASYIQPQPNLAPPLQAFASSTQDPGIFSLSGFDPTLLLQNPRSDIEVNIDQQPQGNIHMANDHFSDLQNLFAGFDPSFLNFPDSGSQLPHSALPISPLDTEESPPTIDPTALLRPTPSSSSNAITGSEPSMMYDIQQQLVQQFDQEHLHYSHGQEGPSQSTLMPAMLLSHPQRQTHGQVQQVPPSESQVYPHNTLSSPVEVETGQSSTSATTRNTASIPTPTPTTYRPPQGAVRTAGGRKVGGSWRPPYPQK